MNRAEALEVLARAGLDGQDASSSLDHAIRKAGATPDDVRLLARGKTTLELVQVFGADGLRAAKILATSDRR